MSLVAPWAKRSLHLVALVCFSSSISAAEPDAAAGDSDEQDILAGHSFHGEAFNEGPRQAAYLMAGMGNVSFPASTENEIAQRFINQGVAQLHGFWYYEAERSFRQAAVLDPDCAICYWGMAMANSSNRKRATEFAAQAVQRKDGLTERERLFVESIAQYCKDKDDKGKTIEKKARAQKYTHDLEQIVEEFPDDIEAKAFLAVQLWQNARASMPIVSHVAINSLIQDIFDVNPMHPAHHYRIHLWDRHKAKRALQSAALCGPALPGIAHMWHMPGHIYSRLNRYKDAVWQQEASARVDHAHMMRDRVLPDQIHNFAHNNEWLIRNLIHIGRVDDAISLAKNMQELPRHPKYNTLKKGSTKYGRERLLLVLSSYRLWPKLIEFADSVYLEATDDPKLQIDRLRHLCVAYALNDQTELAAETLTELASRLALNSDEIESKEAERKAAKEEDKDNANDGDKKKAKANRERKIKQLDAEIKKLKDAKKPLERAIASGNSALAANRGKWEQALEEYDASAFSSDKLLKSEWLANAGKLEEARKLIEKEVESGPGEVLPIATKTWIEYRHGDKEVAKKAFEQTRVLAAVADIDTPLLDRLSPFAADLGYEAHWPAPYEKPSDTKQETDLDTLGPFRWHPYMAPTFSVETADGHKLNSKSLRGKPTIVIFYLGFGCLHCVEQLHEFSPRAEEFRSAGLDIIAISTEDNKSLNTGLSSYSKPLDIPLHSDPDMMAFHSYRCFDDFEKQPLHGTFLIAPDGRVLWQDISYEPFMDVDFVLSESNRLLKLHGFGDTLRNQSTVSTANP